MEPESKEHKIQTLQDMVDVVTRQNLDCLLGDLRNYLVMIMTARETGQFYFPRPGVMNWIDDGRCDVHMPGVTGHATAKVPSMEPAVRKFDRDIEHALQCLVAASIAQSGNTTTVVHPSKPRGEEKEAWVSSEED